MYAIGIQKYFAGGYHGKRRNDRTDQRRTGVRTHRGCGECLLVAKNGAGEMKGGDPMSNRFGGGVPEHQMRVRIGEALEHLPPDVLRLIYRIVCYSESGLE